MENRVGEGPEAQGRQRGTDGGGDDGREAEEVEEQARGCRERSIPGEVDSPRPPEPLTGRPAPLRLRPHCPWGSDQVQCGSDSGDLG